MTILIISAIVLVIVCEISNISVFGFYGKLEIDDINSFLDKAELNGYNDNMLFVYQHNKIEYIGSTTHSIFSRYYIRTTNDSISLFRWGKQSRIIREKHKELLKNK